MFSSLRTLGSDVDHAEALQCLIVAPRLLQNIARAGSPIPRALTQWIRRKALPVLGLDKHPSFWSCLVHGAFEMASSSESPVLLPSEIVPLSDACALFRPSVPSTSKQTERVLSFRRRVRHMLRDSHVRTFVLRRSIGFKSTSFLLPWSVPNGTNQCFQDKILTIFDRIAPLSKHGEPVRALACTYIFWCRLGAHRRSECGGTLIDDVLPGRVYLHELLLLRLDLREITGISPLRREPNGTGEATDWIL